MSVSEAEWNSECVCRKLRGLWGKLLKAEAFEAPNKASSMYLTSTQRERERERSSCWRRRVRQRRSRGLSLLALHWEDCMWEEAERESWRKEGAQERKRASREQAVCVACEGEYIWNPVSGLHSCRQPLHQPLLRCTTWAKGPCSNPGLFPGSVLSCWGWWGSWCRAQTSSITNTRTWYELCLQCRANAPTSRAFTASGTVWRVATSMSWSSAITRATTKHVSNTWSVVWQPSDMLYNDFMLHFIPKWIIGRKRDGWK